MKTYHIYKTDCTKASRLLLQKSWDEECIFVHRGNDEGSIWLSLKSILRLCMKSSINDNYVFHAQSSLPYLLIFIMAGLFMFRVRPVIYDVHDLHEKDGAGMKALIRYVILGIMERLVFKLPYVSVITVSKGLAELLQKRRGNKNIGVVMSVPLGNTNQENLELDRIEYEDALLFFGTGERVPIEELNRIKNEGLNLHVYGRNMPKVLLDSAKKNEFVKYFGAYNPIDMRFLEKYRYLLLVSNIKSENFRISLPNKFFQSLRAGVRPIVTPNFEEMIKIFSSVPGVVIVWDGSTSLRQLLVDNGNYNEFINSKIQIFLDALYSESKNQYKNASLASVHSRMD